MLHKYICDNVINRKLHTFIFFKYRVYLYYVMSFQYDYNADTVIVLSILIAIG